MEPASAIGVASAAITFLEFSIKLFCTTRQIASSASGLSNQHYSIQKIASDLYSQCQALQETGVSDDNALSPYEEKLNEISLSCRSKAEKLQSVVSTLVANGTRGHVWASFSAALKSVIGKEKVMELTSELQESRSTLHTALLMCLWEESRKQKDEDVKMMQTLVQTMSKELQEVRKTWQQQYPDSIDIEEDYCKISRDERNLDYQALAQAIAKRLWDDQCQLEAATGPLDETAAKLIINSLDFPELQTRYNNIPKAYAETLKWIWQQPPSRDDEPLWDSFPAWLKSDDARFYWITGKPGSGKSTLMKYLQQHPNLQRDLAGWRLTENAVPLQIIGYFAWAPGRAIQKSIDGLKQTILFNILKQNPSLIPTVVPQHWAFYQIFADYPCPKDWDAAELDERLTSTLHNFSPLSRLVIFVDGLDEFETAPKSLVAAIQKISEASGHGVKFCVASRPWPAFKDYFEDFPSLEIHQLTHDDIDYFLSTELDACKAYHERKPRSEHLKDIILEKAGGVFLWVSVVTNFLIESLERGDTTADLVSVIECLPEQMVDLYDQIWNRIPQKFRTEAVQIFSLIEASWHQELNFLTLCIAQEEIQGHQDISSALWIAEDSLQIKRTASRRLRSRTFCLLEVLEDDRIGYVHRTAHEWYSRLDTAQYASNFKPEYFLLSALRLQKFHIHMQPWQFMRDFVWISGRAVAHQNYTQEEFDNIANWLHAISYEDRSAATKLDAYYISNWHSQEITVQDYYELAAGFGLTPLFVELAKHDAKLLQGSRLLSNAIFLPAGPNLSQLTPSEEPYVTSGLVNLGTRMQLVQLLLEQGAPPCSKNGRTYSYLPFRNSRLKNWPRMHAFENITKPCSYADLGKEVRFTAKEWAKKNQEVAAYYSNVADLLLTSRFSREAGRLKNNMKFKT